MGKITITIQGMQQIVIMVLMGGIVVIASVLVGAWAVEGAEAVVGAVGRIEATVPAVEGAVGRTEATAPPAAAVEEEEATAAAVSKWKCPRKKRKNWTNYSPCPSFFPRECWKRVPTIIGKRMRK